MLHQIIFSVLALGVNGNEACLYGRSDINSGSWSNVLGWDAFTYAIQEAAYRGDNACVQWLMDNGADPEKQDNWPKWRALYYALRAENYEGAAILLAGGADIDGRSNLSYTQLISWAGQDDVARTQWLLDNGADTEATEFSGDTALHQFVESKGMNYQWGGDPEVPRILLEANPNLLEMTDNGGNTPFLEACNMSAQTLIDFFASMGAVVTARNDDNEDCRALCPSCSIPEQQPVPSPDMRACEDEERQQENKRLKGKAVKSKTETLCDCQTFCEGEGGHSMAYKPNSRQPQKSRCFCYVKKPRKGLKMKNANKYILITGLDEE